MMITALMLADSRFPGGGHVHSGGLEEAAARKLVTDEKSLESFLYGRLHTAGLLAAGFAAARGDLAELDAELDARTPSPAQRAASRAQGRGMLRAARRAWPSPRLDELPRDPHHPIVVGVLVDDPYEAALTCAYLSVSGPASAAVRLLGLDPFGVNAIVAGLSDDMRAVALEATKELPAIGSPALDLLAEAHDRHHQEEVRLFGS
ncbi:urease accessory UreF family protein [Lentzea sp. NBRC 105346]|uniref:urease accessory protein UreF n=1 Tax=Lentzea sp. NBRC 105346 TaxID=3032205 RepID=UPI0025578823|nr:urease accessory UreF family protein [Lentzea sp. NBRC 105346]